MAMSEYLRNKVMTLFKNTNITAFANCYISLHTADPGKTGANEVSTASTGYGRQTVSAANWATPADDGSDFKYTENNVLVSFGPATNAGGWGTVGFFGVWDAASGGNFLWGGTCTQRTVATDDKYEFAVGQIDLKLK